MKLLLFIALATLVLAAKPLFTVILTYPDETPAWAINQDMQNIVDAGGAINQEFDIHKGFSAQAPPDSIYSLSTLSTEYKPTIEGDNIVTEYGDESENHAPMHKRQGRIDPMGIPKFFLGDKVYLLDRVRGSREGPFEISEVVENSGKYILELEDGTDLRDGEEIDVKDLEGA